MESEQTYVHPTEESGKDFFVKFRGKGKFVMLNLLKFKKQADYSQHPELKSSKTISGREAYKLYMRYASPHLEASGGRLLYFGNCGDFVIGPQTVSWDAMLLVEHQSAERFLEFAQNKAYLQIAGHRTAALVDSRLLPIAPIEVSK